MMNLNKKFSEKSARLGHWPVMFSVMYVCLLTGAMSHVTITHDALDITVQTP